VPGATINAAYASGTNRFRGSVWEFLRDTSLNATASSSRGRREAAADAPPVRRRARGPIIKNKAFFFVTTRASADAQAGLVLHHPQPGRAPASWRPRAQSDHGESYPAERRSPDAVRAKVLGGLPDPRAAAPRTTSSSCRPSATTTTRWSEGGRPVQSRLNGFARVGYRNVDIYDQPPLPLPSGDPATASRTSRTCRSRRAHVYARLEPARGAAAGHRAHGAGKNPPPWHAQRAGRLRHRGLPSDPRVAGGSHAAHRRLSGSRRQATNPSGSTRR